MSSALQSWSRLLRQLQMRRTALVLLLFAIALVGAVPSYFSGQWPWSTPPKVETIDQVRAIRQEGLPLPDWQTLEQNVIQIGGRQWSVQQMRATAAAPANTPNEFILLLMPQDWHDKQPQVEWMDLNGFFGRSMTDAEGKPLKWTTDSQRRLQFTVPGVGDRPPVQVTARFLRGWNRAQTYAVVQWYAWSTGGDSAPSRWFWADQRSQLQRKQRMPWVAVSVMIPIKPLGDITPYQAFITSISQQIQTQLMATSLNPAPA